ncbi:Ger(x)C family spore germination protein [Alkalihalobacillus sp. 1P02AB]|uniref:Ger(x)C family spore germination protein n=1 Tax=Alkalihalobacillus sp. 1P02AB TaxID=3132260 RepID=UPI0039A6D52F
MNLFSKTLIFIPFCCLMSGCIATNIIDEVQLMNVVGFDYISDKQIEATISVPLYQQEYMIMSETISAQAKASRDARLKLNTQSSKKLHSGKLKTILINNELASKEGIMTTIDSFTRNATIGLRNRICIVEGTAKEMLSQKYDHEEEVSIYIEELLQQNIEGQNIPETNLLVFLNQNYEEGQDPYLPILRQYENSIQISGLALLKDDKYIDSIDITEAFFLKLLTQRFNRGTHELEIKNKDEYAMIRTIHSVPHFRIEKNSNEPNIEIDIKMKIQLIEYSGTEISDKKLKEIHDLLQKDVIEQSKALIKKFQKLGIDPIGIGSLVRSKNSDFDLNQWQAYYKNMDVTINPKLIIVDKGIKQ